MAPRQQWYETLRLTIRQEHGKGWSVREIGATNRNPIGRCQLTRRWEDRTRSSVVLPLDWKATNATAILSAVGQLQTLMEERNLSLQDANRLNTELLARPQQNADEEFAGWPEVAARFLRSQEGRRSSTLRADHESAAHPASPPEQARSTGWWKRDEDLRGAVLRELPFRRGRAQAEALGPGKARRESRTALPAANVERMAEEKSISLLTKALAKDVYV